MNFPSFINLRDFDLGGFRIGDYDVEDFNLGDFDLTPKKNRFKYEFLLFFFLICSSIMHTTAIGRIKIKVLMKSVPIK